jgi:hypothetical protein
MANTSVRTARSAEELLAAATHLSYEISMLASTAALLSDPDIADTPTENAVLESFTVHARALMHFLFPKGRIDDEDVLASDYFNDPSVWDVLRGDLPKALEKVRSRVGTEIAHLSYARLTTLPAAKGWDVAAILGALTDLIDRFKQGADRLPNPEFATALIVFNTAPSATNDFKTSVSSPGVNSSYPERK